MRAQCEDYDQWLLVHMRSRVGETLIVSLLSVSAQGSDNVRICLRFETHASLVVSL